VARPKQQAQRGATQSGAPSSSRLSTIITPAASREDGKKARREERGREQGEAAEKGNQASSTRTPRVVTGRPLHATKIASLLTILCAGFC